MHPFRAARTDRAVRRHTWACVFVVGGSALLLGCGGSDTAAPIGAEQLTSSRTTEIDVLDPCAQQNLTTIVPAQLTVAVTTSRDPALLTQNEREEWIGQESNAVYALGAALGFGSAQVIWLGDPVTPEEFVSGEVADILVGQVSAQEIESAGGVASLPFASAGSDALVMGVLPGNPLRTCVDEALVELETSGQLTAS